MILATIRQLPALLAPPGDFFWGRPGSGFAGGGAITLFVWAALFLLRLGACLLTGRVVLPTRWRTAQG